MREWFSIKNEAGEDTPIEVDIYGPIGKSWYDDDAVAASDVLEALKGANGRDVVMHINSEGGSVFDGFAISTLLRDSASHVTAYIDGLCASAASYIAAAADEVIMSDLAWMMIHEASGFVWGTKADMRKQADVLESIDGTIARAYSVRSDVDAEEFARLMQEETWMDAETAKAYGLVDRIAAGLPVAAAIDLRGLNALDSAPIEARAALAAMGRAGDTEGNIDPDDGDGTEAQAEEPAPKASRVVDGRIFDK